MVARSRSANSKATAGNGHGSNGNAPTSRANVRVAVYVRISIADHGQEFGSLDNQRAAVLAFIESQRAEGWQPLPNDYSDDGFSGGSVERPALQRLLDDVRAGCIDVVAVHRLDRLSRSLRDFGRLMELFEQHGVAFVSITQSFNTSTSVGRLTLHLLMTFAQFERETIAERVSTKMLATRKRGMWCGGRPVLGYDVRDKQLVVNQSEAEVVRTIFQLYLKLGSLIAMLNELAKRGIGNKCWTTKKGAVHRGAAFSKSVLRSLLGNPVYLGKVRCGTDVVDGRHEAIVDAALFDAVQQQMKSGRRNWRSTRIPSNALLRGGILVCGTCGAPMIHRSSSSKKGNRRHRYYACGEATKRGAAACPGSRVAAGDVEQFIAERIAEIGRDPALVKLVSAHAREQIAARAPDLRDELARLTRDGARLTTERGNLVAAIGEGGGARSTLLARLTEVEAQLTELTAKRDALAAELGELEGSVVDEQDLREALAAFTPIWNELFPAERERVLRLLVERIAFDAQQREVTITFRPDGVRALAAEAKGKR